MNIEILIVICGLLDLSSLGWYLGSRVLNGVLPFYYDIAMSIRTGLAFGGSMATISPIITTVSMLLYISLAFSGYYLIRLNRIGAVLSYIQTPFRVLALMPPSIFFLLWPVKYIFTPNIHVKEAIIVFSLLLLSEGLKTIIVVLWQKKSAHNH
jgi:hypothetical protein